MTFNALIVVCGLIALALLLAAARSFRRHRIVGGLIRSASALLVLVIAGVAVLAAVNLRAYQPLSAEQPAGELSFTRIGYHEFNGVYTPPTGARADFALRGDEMSAACHAPCIP